MAVDPGLRERAEELWSRLGAIRCRPMFGGLGVYADGLFFAIAIGDGLYVKGDDLNEEAMVAGGSSRFTYPGRGGEPHALRYWRLPDSAFDDEEEALLWGRRGLEAAMRAASGAPARRRRGAVG